MKYTVSNLAGLSRKTMDTFLHPKILWLSLIAIMACASAIATFSSYPIRPVTIWFPGARGKGAVAELRYLRAQNNPESAARALVEEIILGPMREDLSPMTDPSADILLVMARNRSLFVDLSADVLFGKRMASGLMALASVATDRLLSLVERTLSWNFPGRRLTLSIEGHTPSVEAFEQVTVEGKKE